VLYHGLKFFGDPLGPGRKLFFAVFLLLVLPARAPSANSWKGIVHDKPGHAVAEATVSLQAFSGSRVYSANTSASGEFFFADIAAQTYRVAVKVNGKTWNAVELLVIKDGAALAADLELSEQDQTLVVMTRAAPASPQASGGEHLTGGEVSSLPLNTRDFSKLLLLAAGTMTDTNGTANFTQQFTANGQRGTTSVFAMDGVDTSDPEMGGATFSNFNVDAIQEVQSSSGVMPAEIGHGAAGFNNVITKSGSSQVHGSAFEFVRNAAFDARNYFDHASAIDPRRLPPFARNEFGVTNGGPVVIPGIYNGRDKTFYFAEYQGFRQVLGTTQVFAVPTEDERKGIDTTAYPRTATSPGDTLTVPVSAAIAPLLARYPLPNEPTGPYGARTYATSSKVVTNTDQFSVRVDHQISDKAALFTRFSLNQVDGPTTNPDQTAIDPSFAVNFFDHQRNAAVRYTRTISPHLNFAASFGYIRSTPIFPTQNQTDPALTFGDGLFEGFNTADGSITGSYSNLYQAKFDMAYVRGAHSFKWGVEIRLNKDSTIFGTNPNGLYMFGGGPAYSPVQILSASGQHDIQPGDKLPDALTGLLTATPYYYSITAASSVTPLGDKFDEAAVRREAYNFYFQDAWKFSPRWMVSYGLRYEVNSRIKEAKHRTSMGVPIGPDGQPVPFFTPGATEIFLYNPQPAYPMDWKGLGPRIAVDFAVTHRTTIHAGGALTTILPNLWQENFVTGGIPFVFQPANTALPGFPVPFHNTAVPLALPPTYTTSGQLLFPNGDSSNVAANTQIDLQRFQSDLQDLTPGHEVQLLSTGIISRGFQNGYIGTYTLGVDHDLGGVKMSAAYVGTSGIHLASVIYPNGYAGADPGYAPYTQFNSAGQAIGGFGSEAVMATGSHSSYNALQTSVSQNTSRIGLSFQASYTFSKSLDDTSGVFGGSSSGVIALSSPQDPRNTRAEKGPSTFDVRHVFSLSLIQLLPFDRVGFLKPLGKYVTGGWQFLNITSLTSGPPFTVYSGIQQTGAGAGGADRPDLVSTPDFSTSRATREDYFGRGPTKTDPSNHNDSFFSIPIGVPGGTGPYSGRFGTLGRDTFRGPGFHQYDISLIKNTPLGHRGNGELGILQFRAEFFNVFNIVNFGLPSNIVMGSGFGMISHTAGPSRQIQFSLKLVY
jgi:Carboxypeptidase regulatory-like domain